VSVPAEGKLKGGNGAVKKQKTSQRPTQPPAPGKSKGATL